MDLLHLVDRLEELVAGAQKMPIGNRAILDRRRMLDLIDQMRIAVPHEVREAQDVVANRDAIRREAEEEGRIIVAEAEGRAARMVEEHNITEAAHRRAEEIAQEAERRLEARVDEANRDIQNRLLESRRLAREQMEAADEYARELLVRLERQLTAFQNSVHAGIQQLEPQPTFNPRDLPPLDDRDDEPVVTRIGRGGNVSTAEQRYDDDGDLENLLRRPAPSRARGVEPEPGVIDDFDLDPLDDDPTYRAPRDDDRG